MRRTSILEHSTHYDSIIMLASPSENTIDDGFALVNDLILKRDS
ncbi:MAG: hypothetical protein V1754_12595 [Pseudomonadota bacterium]